MSHDDNSNHCNRRGALRRIAAISGMAALPALGISGTAFAGGKASKSALQYQDKPKGKQECDNCVNFIAPASGKKMGKCKVVAGSIDPKGWCLAYARKS